MQFPHLTPPDPTFSPPAGMHQTQSPTPPVIGVGGGVGCFFEAGINPQSFPTCEEHMTHTAECATILAMLDASPKTTPELVTATGIKGAKLGNVIKALLREGKISRTLITRGRYCYYHGDSAPGWVPIAEQPPKVPTTHAVPVKVVDVAVSYFGDAVARRVTLPAAPWEMQP